MYGRPPGNRGFSRRVVNPKAVALREQPVSLARPTFVFGVILIQGSSSLSRDDPTGRRSFILRSTGMYSGPEIQDNNFRTAVELSNIKKPKRRCFHLDSLLCKSVVEVQRRAQVARVPGMTGRNRFLKNKYLYTYIHIYIYLYSRARV